MIMKFNRFIILFAVALALGLCLAALRAKSEPAQFPGAAPKPAKATSGRFFDVLTKEEVAYFTESGQDPQTDLEARVADMKANWYRIRRAAAADKLPDELLGLSDTETAKAVAAAKKELGK